MKDRQIRDRRPKFLDPWVARITSLLICVLVFGLLIGVRSIGYMQAAELKFYDVLVRNRWHKEPESKNVIVIGITEKDMKSGGWLSPSDHQLAKLLERLAPEAAAIGVDLIRDRAYLDPVVDKDAKVDEKGRLIGPGELEDVLKGNDGKIVMISRLPVSDLPDVPVPGGLTWESGQKALADIAEDADGVVRRGIVNRWNGEREDAMPNYNDDDYLDPINTFAVALAKKKLDEPCALDDECQIGKAKYPSLGPDDGPYVSANHPGRMFLLDYASGSIRNVNYSTALDPVQLPATEVRGKVVLIGKRSEIDKDYFNTPIQSNQYGVDLHAQIIDQLIRAGHAGGRLPGVWSRIGENSWILLWTAFGATIAYNLRRPLFFIPLVIGGPLLIVAAGFLAFNTFNFLIPVVPAFVGLLTAAIFVTSYAVYLEVRTRQWVERFLGAMLGHRIAGRLRDLIGEDGRLVTKALTATVLFTDIKGFGDVAERLEAGELMDWLNRFMNEMSRLVSAHGGQVNKFIGDSIMGVFGVPMPRTGPEIAADAVAAVNCALAMRGELDVLCAQYRQSDMIEPEGMRIGIHTGPLVAGSVGSDERMEYTVIGGTVNKASRLESLKPASGGISPEHQAKLDDPAIHDRCCRILISRETYNYVKDLFEVREIPNVELQGVGSVDIYGVVGPKLGTGAAAAAAGKKARPKPAAVPATAAGDAAVTAAAAAASAGSDADDDDEAIPAGIGH